MTTAGHLENACSPCVKELGDNIPTRTRGAGNRLLRARISSAYLRLSEIPSRLPARQSCNQNVVNAMFRGTTLAQRSFGTTSSHGEYWLFSATFSAAMFEEFPFGANCQASGANCHDRQSPRVRSRTGPRAPLLRPCSTLPYPSNGSLRARRPARSFAGCAAAWTSTLPPTRAVHNAISLRINQSRKYKRQHHAVQFTLKHPVTRCMRIMNPSAHLVRVA